MTELLTQLRQAVDVYRQSVVMVTYDRVPPGTRAACFSWPMAAWPES